MTRPVARTIILTDAGAVAYTAKLAAYDGTVVGLPVPDPVPDPTPTPSPTPTPTPTPTPLPATWDDTGTWTDSTEAGAFFTAATRQSINDFYAQLQAKDGGAALPQVQNGASLADVRATFNAALDRLAALESVAETPTPSPTPSPTPTPTPTPSPAPTGWRDSATWNDNATWSDNA